MYKNKIKNLIIDILSTYEDRVLTGFMPLDNFREIASGDLNWGLLTEDHSPTNILLLANINQDCLEAFTELKDDSVIDLRPFDPFLAMAEGDLYKLPIATKVKKYKSLHWLPMLVFKGPKFPKDKNI
jgi:hypothetical protein